jgi:glycosyltransferase involved in cell wall biosynthesis
MRVVHVIPSIAPERGGPTYVVTHLARALAQRGVEVVILATRSDLTDAGEAEVRRQLGAQVKLELVPIVGSTRFEVAPTLLPRLARLARRADLVHVHTVFTFPPAVAPPLCQLLAVPCVIRPAGTLDEACLGLRATREKRLAIAGYVRRNLMGADAIQATSELERGDLERLAPGARIELVELGVHIGELAPAEGPGNRRIGSLGRLHPIKRLDTLIAALVEIPGAELALAGSGDPDHVAKLRALADRLGVADRVRWLGHLGETAKQAFVAHCDVLAFPSLHESFGVAVAEAMAQGRPVLVSPEVGVATQIAERRAGQVVSAGPAAWARAIAALLDSPDERARMGAAGRALIRARYSWDAAAERTLALYRDIAQPRARRGPF